MSESALCRATCWAWALVKEALYAALRVSGIAGLGRRVLSRRGVAVFVYHRPTPETLDNHLRYLRRVATVIPLDALVDALARHDFSSLPARSVVITIDDGHRSNRALLDVFLAHGAASTIFACTQIVGTRRPYWWTVVDHRDRKRLMRVSNAERVSELRDRYRFSDGDEVPERQALTFAELRELASVADLEPHTRSHPILTSCEQQVVEEEVVGSKCDLELLLGRPCRHFAYPNGDHGPREVAIVKAAGFASARTIEPGWNRPDTDPYQLKVLGIADNASVNAVAAHLAGIQLVRRLGPLLRALRSRRLAQSRLDLGYGPTGCGRPTVEP